jgi:hypothetical protein
MAPERVGDMTLDELKLLIVQMIDKELPRTQTWPRSHPKRSVSDVLQSMRDNLIQPRVGEPSAVEMVLEDRNRWNDG